MLPSPNSPNITIIDDGFTEEVVGGMDWGFQEKTTNLQDEVTKGGCLPHVLHEGLVDHRTELRAYDSPKNWKKRGEEVIAAKSKQR